MFHSDEYDVIVVGEENSTDPIFSLSASGHSVDDFTVALDDDPAPVTCDNGQTYDQTDVPLINTLGGDDLYAVCGTKRRLFLR